MHANRLFSRWLMALMLSGLSIASSNCDSDPAFNASVLRWEWEPRLEPLSNGDAGQYLNLSSGVDIWYTTMGPKESRHTPVLILHGGIGNSNQMYQQANMLAKTRQVILQDTRGQGRSPYANFDGFHYDDFTRDAIALLDLLDIPLVAVLGWSDGAITGLDLAMNYSSRIERVFAHGANIQANQSIPGTNDPIINSKSGSFDADFSTNGTTFSTGSSRLRKREDSDPYSCEALSPLPSRCADMYDGISLMWVTEPSWGPKEMAKIKCPVWVVDGDHDLEVQRNQADSIAAWIPYAGQLILPQVGHDALLQDHVFFNFAVQYFMDIKFEGTAPVY